VALVRPLWSAELWAGGGSRAYPELEVQERMGGTATYDELTWSAGTTFRLSGGPRLALRTQAIRQATDSADPLFDSDSWVVRADVDAGLAGQLVLMIHGAYQKRAFDNRPLGEDSDEYWQAGLGLRYAFAPGWAVTARWGYSEYTWPDGAGEHAQRFVAGVTRVWGRPDVVPLPRVDVDALTRADGGYARRPDASGRVCLRVLAPGARQVSVVGTFNAWDPEASPLDSVGNGRWEGCLEIEPGLHEYAYVIDGEWTTPPEATAVVEDGFGGRNGILEVVPADL
jgi:hypothetical protein